MQKKAAEKPFPRELEITYVRGDSEGSRRERKLQMYCTVCIRSPTATTLLLNDRELR